MVDLTTAAVLNDLIKLSMDSQQSYIEAAEYAHSEDFKKVFLDYAEQRGAFVEELSALVHAVDNVPAESGTYEAEVFRTVVKFKLSMSRDEDKLILEAVLDRMEHALAKYRDGLATVDLPHPVREVLETQIDALNTTKAHIEQLLGRHDKES